VKKFQTKQIKCGAVSGVKLSAGDPNDSVVAVSEFTPLTSL
jgi:hypothetical protein